MKSRSSFGWIELIVGILLIVLAVLTFLSPASALKSFVIVYGIAIILGGIADIAFFARIDRRTGFGPVMSLVSGILSILIGILLLFNIGAGIFAVGFLFPIWFLIHCISRLFNLNFVKHVAGNGAFWLSLVVHMIGIVLAVVLLFNPYASATFLSYLIGIVLLALGVGSIFNAFSRLGARS